MSPTKSTNRPVVALVLLIFFVISVITNILGPLVPEFIRSFSLSLALAGFLPFSFFVAYAVMSIPSGMLVERYREKAVLASAFAAACLGSLAFALVPTFRVGLSSLFLIGLGMATLQVAANPLLRVAGGERHFAFNSVLAQLVFGVGSAISPHVYSYLVDRLTRGARGDALVDMLARLAPADLPWVSMYWLFSVLALLMAAVVVAIRLPRVELKEDERIGGWPAHAALLRHPHVLLYTFGIFCYVGMEQGTANWMSQFLQTYHGFDPRTTGANAVSSFWGLMTAGCIVGLVLLKLVDSRHVLVGASAAAMLALTAALFGPAQVSLTAFPLIGFCASVMWSIIFSLAMNSVTEHHGSLSGILCTAIVGGAVVPLLIGWQGDLVGLRQSLLLLYVPLGYILTIGFWARPLVNNATIFEKTSTDVRPA